MGKEKYIKQVEHLLEKSPVVTSGSIKHMVKSRQYAGQLIRQFIIKEKMQRLAKGCYSAIGDPSLAVFCFKPAYLGLQDALSFHNLWEQETIPVIITSARVRQGLRNIGGGNALIRRLDKKYLFGYTYYSSVSDLYLPYSDLEKTFIDFVYFRQHIDKQPLKEIIKRIDRKKLASYLTRYPTLIQKRVQNLLNIS